MSACPDYRPWSTAPAPLNSAECWHYWQGYCECGGSPLAGQPCPWAGRPEEAAAVSRELVARVAGGEPGPPDWRWGRKGQP